MRRDDLRADGIMTMNEAALRERVSADRTEKAWKAPGITANPIFALTLYVFLFSLLLPLMTKLLS